MKLQKSIITLAAVLASTAFASTAAAQAPFKVTEVITGGTGCPEGTASTRQSAGGGEQELNIRFRDFEVEGSGPVITSNQRRAVTNSETCQIAARVDVPAGFQLALVDIDLRGTVDVQGRRDTQLGVNNVARIEREYFFNDAGGLGDLDTTRSTTLVNSDGNYSISDNFAFLSYSACGQKNVLARTRLTLSVAGRNNYASIRAVEEEIDNIRLGFRLRRCDSGATIIPVAGSETVTNACVLEGSRRICYDRSGRQISNSAD